MKKFLLILVVLSVMFASCASPVSEPEPEAPAAKVNPFEGKWSYVGTGNIAEVRGNSWISSGISDTGSPYTSSFTYEYDETYLYKRSTNPGLSHIVYKHRYEFKDNGNMMYQYWVPSGYNTTPDDYILQKIVD